MKKSYIASVEIDNECLFLILVKVSVGTTTISADTECETEAVNAGNSCCIIYSEKNLIIFCKTFKSVKGHLQLQKINMAGFFGPPAMDAPYDTPQPDNDE